MAISFEDLISVQEAAQLMGRSRQRVQSLIQSGQLESLFDGRHHIPRQQVLDLMAKDRPTGGRRAQPELMPGHISTAQFAEMLGVTPGRAKVLWWEHLQDPSRGVPSVIGPDGRRYIPRAAAEAYAAVPHRGGRQPKPVDGTKPPKHRTAARRQTRRIRG